MTSNEDQIAFWNGETGGAWARRAESLDHIFLELTTAILAAAKIRSGEHVLDLGCGAGGMILEAAAGCGPLGKVTGIDVSGPLIEIARRRTSGTGNVRLIKGDASTFPFEPGSVDVAISRLGAMFFDNPVETFSTLRRALTTQGRLVLCVWQAPRKNLWAMEPISAVRSLVEMPPRPGPDDPGAFSFGDPVRVRHVLEKAGFATPHLNSLEVGLPIGNSVEEAVEFTLEVGPLAEPLRDLKGDARRQALSALAEVMAAHRDRSGIVRLAGACWIVTTRVR